MIRNTAPGREVWVWWGDIGGWERGRIVGPSQGLLLAKEGWVQVQLDRPGATAGIFTERHRRDLYTEEQMLRLQLLRVAGVK